MFYQVFFGAVTQSRSMSMNDSALNPLLPG
jgi:hypothetical protein